MVAEPKKWRITIAEVLREWARARNLPKGSVVKVEVVKGQAKVVVKEIIDEHPPEVVEFPRQA